MSKPLGYYTTHTPGDGSTLDSLQEQYGAAFEKITKREKLVILTVLASGLGCEMDGDCRAEIFDIARVMSERLTMSDRAGVMEAIINQIRWGQNAELVHHS
ncbi:hypothetical protein [Nostoc sp.]|uniref:hypothetical protein n=1 Tax=Nostoc sp. TaxID=1180 RepID=UPI002FF79731